MPLRYKIIPEKRLVYVVGEKRITLEELFQHLETLAKDPLYVAPMKKLIDYRICDKIGGSNEEIAAFLGKKVEFIEKFKGENSAMIVNNDLDFGISRMIGAQQEMYGLEMFVTRSFDEALQALDLELNDNDLAFD
jgi:hypothetical protein